MLNLEKTKQLVGLDIGSSSVKTVELKVRKKGGQELYELVKTGYEALPQDAIVEGTIIDTTAVSETIKMTFNENKISNKNVAISVCGNSVIIKKISLPPMEPEELSESITWEAKHNIPYSYDEIEVDYALLPSPQDKEKDEVEILLVAAKKDKIENYSAVVNQSQKNLVAIEVDALALYNALELNYPQEFHQKNIALINGGAYMTNVLIVEKSIPQLFRDLPLGGFYLAENIKNELNISFEEAEKLLKGIPSETLSPQQEEAVMTMSIKEFLEEAEKTFSLYESSESEEKKIELIFLSGGLAKLKNISSYFEEKFGLKTEIFNPFRNVYFNEKKFDPIYIQEMSPLLAVACGLATRRA
ncbi:MAG: type IV pilus assembly protein PilM [Candidatus Aminicenantales bacterium]